MKARIPADVEMPDRIFFGLTFRQISIIGVDAFIVWAIFVLLKEQLELWVVGLICAPIAITGLILVAARPAGVTPERFLGFAVGHLLQPKLLVRSMDERSGKRGHGEAGSNKRNEKPTRPGGPGQDGRQQPLAPSRTEGSQSGFALPLRGVTDNGQLDLGSDGLVAICRASCINFTLRSDAEKKLLTGGFARMLNSLDGPVQFLIHSEPADAEALIRALEARAPQLPNPSLAAAAFSYADFLRSVTSQSDVLTSSVFVCLRERRRTTESARRLDRRVEEMSSLVRQLGVAMARLDGPEASELLGRTADPSIIGSDAGAGEDGPDVRGRESKPDQGGYRGRLAPRSRANVGEALC